eukprot:g5884.t1
MNESRESGIQNSRREIGELFFKASIDEQNTSEIDNQEHAVEKQQCEFQYIFRTLLLNSAFVLLVYSSEDSTTRDLAKAQMELWKKSEISKLQTRLKRVEYERMRVLETEWNKHEKQRYKEFAEWSEQIQTAKQDLKAAITRVEERERKLISLQESLTRRRKDLERQHSTKVQEAEDTIKRLQTEFEQHLTLAKERTTEAGTRNNQLKELLRLSSERVAELENTISELRKASAHSDVIVLQKEVENYKKMFSDAQSRIEVLEAEKNNFKTRICDLARRLAEAQASRSVNSTTEVSCEEKTQEESAKEHFIRQYQKDSDDLNTLKSEVNQLRQRVETNSQEQKQTDVLAAEEKLDFDTIDASAVKNDDLRQMLVNRKELLDTGLYTKDDALILELELRIKELIDEPSKISF